MDDKKFQKAIDILLKQAATTHADGEMTREEQKDHAKRISVLERAVINLYITSVQQGENIERQGVSIDKQGKQIDKLIEAQHHRNERLDAVIFMAEKYFSGENGKSKK